MEYVKEIVIILKIVTTPSWGGVIDGEEHHVEI